MLGDSWCVCLKILSGAASCRNHCDVCPGWFELCVCVSLVGNDHHTLQLLLNSHVSGGFVSFVCCQSCFPHVCSFLRKSQLTWETQTRLWHGYIPVSHTQTHNISCFLCKDGCVACKCVCVCVCVWLCVLLLYIYLLPFFSGTLHFRFKFICAFSSGRSSFIWFFTQAKFLLNPQAFSAGADPRSRWTVWMVSHLWGPWPLPPFSLLCGP